MATNTKIIKIKGGENGSLTYVPVTLASAVQYSYNGGVMSMQDALGTVAATVIPISGHLGATVSLSNAANSKDIVLGGTAHGASGTVSIDATNALTADGTTANNITIKHADQTSAAEVAGKALNASGGTAADSVDVITGIKRDAYGHVVGIVSGKTQNTRPNSANLTVAGDTGSQVAFNSDESSAKTLNIKGATGTPIETVVASGVNVTIKHKDSGVTAGTYGTNSTTTISAGSTGSIVVPQVAVNSYGHVTSASDQSISIDLSGLTGAMHWVGLSTTDPKGSSGATFSGHTTWLKGDVVTYNSKEYVLSGDSNTAANWLELGDEGSHALKGTTTCSAGDGLTGTTMYAYVTGSNGSIQHAVPSGAAAGTKNSADNNFIKSVTTDKFGHVTAYTTGTFTQDHTGTGTSGKLTYWNGDTTHTAVTNSYGNSTNKYAYVEAGVLKEGILPAAPNMFSTIKANGDNSGTDAVTSSANTVEITPDSTSDTLTIATGNKWIDIAFDTADDKITIGHSAGLTAKTEALYKIATDQAGHVTSSTAVTINSIKYDTYDAPYEFTLNLGSAKSTNNTIITNIS